MEYSDLLTFLLLILLVWISYSYFRLKTSVEERARTLHNRWRDEDLSFFQSQMEQQTDEKIRIWKNDEERSIRQDAIKRSREVIHGKVTEHLIPFFSSFRWNPADARFLGSPIDFVIFDGLSEGEVREIVFVEVKSGVRPTLTPRERSVERCIKRGDIDFTVIHHINQK